MRPGRRGVGAVFVALLAVTAVPGLVGSPAGGADAKVPVVAAQDFWGSIARQLGGDHADVQSVIDDPGTHAHDYEPKPSDAVAFAGAAIAVINGIGYDPWASELLAANPSSTRRVIDVGELVGVGEDGNPHQWYSPSSVDRVVDAVTDALKQADPANAGYFDRQRQVYRTETLEGYRDLLTRIGASFGGTPVGASESIVAPLAEDLGLEVLTPPAFQVAIAEGGDPTAADKATVDRQIAGREVKVFIHNAQNSTPDVVALVRQAEKAGIPVVTVTETPNPPGTLFQDWQVAQLRALAAALSEATGKPLPGGVGTAPAASAASGRLAGTGTGTGTGSGTGSGPGAGAWWLVAGLVVLGGLGAAAGAAFRRRRSPTGTS